MNNARDIETKYLNDKFASIMRDLYHVDMTSFAIEYDDACEIIRVRCNDDDETTFACAIGSDDDTYEFHHASFDDRIIFHIPLMID